MPKKKINLEEILISKLEENSTEDFNLKIISKLHFIACYYAMKEACKQVLELAAENAKIKVGNYFDTESEYINYTIDSDEEFFIHDEKSVLSKKLILDTINQVE